MSAHQSFSMDAPEVEPQSHAPSARKGAKPVMAPPARLTVISPPLAAPEPRVEARAERIRRLQAEAQALAREQIALLQEQLLEVTRLAQEIADGGDAYPIGARELSRRLAEDLPRQAGTLSAIARKA
jgi:hypothetical protein